MADVLIVEDEAAIADLIEMQVKLAGHTPAVLHSGGDVMGRIKERCPDIVILDVMLPGRDGFSLMQDIRPLGIPVIFLTAKERMEDKVTGLKLGADDYMVKPFAAIELTTRIEAVLRRCKKGKKGNERNEVFRVGGAEVRLDEHTAFCNGQKVELTSKEFDLLRVLIDNRNLALSREKLLELAWGFDYMGETRTVDVHIQRLRKKLGLDGSIVTVYKHGYRLEVPR
jgi:DNA-binding response OmpR family regulator